jgi:hypothetical protein
MSLRLLSADDIFISYARRDSSTYASGLADELTKRGFSCFISPKYIAWATQLG